MKNLIIGALVVALAITGYLLYRKDSRVGEPKPSSPQESIEIVEIDASDDPLFSSHENKMITETGETYEITANYPVFGDSNIDEGIESFVRADIAGFKNNNNLSYDNQSAPNSYELSYEVKQDSLMTTVLFKAYEFTGGAHGNLRIVSRSYSPTGEARTIGSLFVPDSSYLGQLSDVSRTLLQEKYGDMLGAWYEDGTSPRTENFETFYIEGSDTLAVVFQPYQVGPWAIGAPEVRIPLETFEAILHEDYR